MKDEKLIKYLIAAFAIAWPMQGAAAYFAWQGQAGFYRMLLTGSMYAPCAATLIAGIPLREMGWKPSLREGKWKAFLSAWLGPAVLGAVGAALYFLIFPARLDTTGKFLIAQLGETGLAQLQAQGLTPQSYLAVSAVQALTWAPFLNMLAALGEEIGWRGAMYPRLRDRFGTRGGRILGGVIWGAWHWPIMVLAGYEYGLQYPGAPVLGPILFCVFSAGTGILLDVLYEKTHCIWIPSLGHGAVNAFAGIPLLLLDPAFADQMILGPSMIGIIAGLPLLVTAVLLLRRS